jgi:hypothetical protein
VCVCVCGKMYLPHLIGEVYEKDKHLGRCWILYLEVITHKPY